MNLRNDVDGGSVAAEVPLWDVVAVDEDGALDGLQEPEDGEDQRGLSGPGSTDNRDLFTWKWGSEAFVC